MKVKVISGFLVLFSFCTCASIALAQAGHPIEVERAAARGEYLKALETFDQIPSRKASSASVIAAARSAWALGLTERAIKEFDRALRDPELNAQQRGKLLLSRGIIEFQEGRYQVAALYAEKATTALSEASALRGQAWLLWAESDVKLGAYGSAEDKYKLALSEVAAEERFDINFKLARCQISLGKLEDARQNFESVPMQHESAPAAIRSLASIALEQKRFKQAAFWLEQGRQNFPESFLDSWVDYALIVVAAGENDRKRVVSLQDAAAKKYPPSDYWFTLANSAAEAYLWSESRAGVLNNRNTAGAKG